MQCPKCNRMLDDGVKYCPDDGTPLMDTAATLAAPTPTAPGLGQRPPGREIELPAVVGGRYRLIEVRGGGGMAKVYRGTDITLERDVAVKLINPELRNEAEFDARFSREAKIASQLADPHIVVVHDFGLDPDYGPFLVMEYLQGQSLRERLQSEGPLPYKAVLQLAGQVLLALMHAHEKGIVHRDIKPDNVFLLNQSGVRLHVRVLDFGIARIYRGEDSTGSTITSAGAVLGTPRYMSPEQLAGQPADARSDLYSCALLLYEALTGKLHYTDSKRLCEVCPEATEAFQELIEQCLKGSPAERPTTALEAYLRLQELGKASGILLMPPGAMDRLLAGRKKADPTAVAPPEPPNLTRRALIGGGVVAALAGAAYLGWWALFHEPEWKGPETLLGLKIDDDEAQARDSVPRSDTDHGHPWKGKAKKALGQVLTPEDLRLNAAETGQVKARWSADDSVCVLSFRDKILAVIAHRQGGTGRGVRIGHDVNRMERLYDTGGRAEDRELPDGTSIRVWRFDKVGVGFETKGRYVTGITLYPPAKP